MPGNLMFWILFYFLTYDAAILEEGKKKQPYMQQPRTVTSSKESLTVWLWQTKKKSFSGTGCKNDLLSITLLNLKCHVKFKIEVVRK